MSSTFELRSAYYLPTPPTRQDPSEGLNLRQDPGWEGRLQSLFRNGLPTPPAARIMSSMTVKSYNPKTNSGQPYNHNSLRYPLHNIPSAISHSENRPFQGRDVEELANQHNLCRHSASKSKDSEDDSARKSPVNRIASNFRIPESVNSSGGSLAEFAAEITCLFWFESAATLRQAEGFTGGSCIDRGLLPDATPTIGFRKWVTTILTTTLISRNVILLALLFIYRLKQFNPDVSGKRGSEFRLLTIALMLGNKFLDDNTYTNKTWAEVSGISVTEIHIMEVEFLSNMRYNLYVSEAEWGRWKVKLGSFGSFFRTASNVPSMDASPAPVTPMLQGFPHKLPSPPSTHHSSVSYSIARPGAANYPALPKHYSTALVPPQSPIRPDQTTLSDFPGRKRGLDSFSELPPAKRLFPESSLTPYSTTSTPGTMGTTPAGQWPAPRRAGSKIADAQNSHYYEPVGRLQRIAARTNFFAEWTSDVDSLSVFFKYMAPTNDSRVHNPNLERELVFKPDSKSWEFFEKSQCFSLCEHLAKCAFISHSKPI